MKSMALSYALKKRAKKMMADGGLVKLKEASSQPQPVTQKEHEERGKIVHRNEIEKLKDSPRPLKGLAEGGEVHDEDMVDRIMKKRCMSEGGMVANGGEDDLDRMADGMPNEFDDLALRDDLEFSYTGENSGDSLGDAQEDDDRHDIVSRVMRSRAKKDRMPRPA